MAAPALRIPVGLNLDTFEQHTSKLKAGVSTITKQVTKQFVDMNASVIATQGAAGGAVLGMRSLLGLMGPLAVAAGAVAATFKLMGYATELAKEKIEEFNETAEKAAKSNVSTDFFQRFVKGGETLKLTADEATAALERFNRVSTAKLGGSDLQQRITALSEAGNFAGNSGPGSLGAANNSEQRLRATVQLIDEALQKGERLAALDIAEKAFGSKVADNLRTNSGYLTQLLDTADKISKTKIVSDEQVAQAIDLKTRLEAAQKTLEERFKPVQDDLAKLGMNYEESWIGIYERIAQAVGVANQLYDGLKGIPDVLARAGNAGFWSKITEFSGRLGLNSTPDFLTETGQQKINGQIGGDALRTALGNPNNITNAMRQASDVATAVRGDKSKPIKKDEAPTAEEISAYDREIERLNRTIALRQADAAAVGQTREVQEQYRAELTLLQALNKDGEAITNEQIATYGRLRVELGSVGALQAAGITLSQQQSEQFRNISARALETGNALRIARDSFQGINDSLRFFGDQTANILDGVLNKTTSFQQGMQQVLQNVQRQFINAALTGEGAFGKILGLANPTGGVGGIFGGIASLFGRAAGGPVSAGQPYIVGEKGPEIMVPGKSGTVIPNNVVSRSGVGGGVTVIVNSSPVFQAGMTPTDTATIRAMMETNNQQLRGAIVTDLRRGVAADSRFLG